jgi:cytochrome c
VGTRDEAKALAIAAAAHVKAVGSSQAFKDFAADPKWHPKDMFVFAPGHRRHHAVSRCQ